MTSGTAGWKLVKVATSTFDSSLRRNAMDCESGDHQKPSSSW